ncbi:MAG: hypothetical protein HY093_00165 [Candidatus Liptonbacteria bacterium]|nr:hypothetical protein [Candidatus Liptonbacteria bacterium]
MKVAFSKKALNDYLNLSRDFQAKADKQFSLIIKNFRHPSIRVKKYDEALNIWQGRIDKKYRFFFKIASDVAFVIAITKHPK